MVKTNYDSTPRVRAPLLGVPDADAFLRNMTARLTLGNPIRLIPAVAFGFGSHRKTGDVWRLVSTRGTVFFRLGADARFVNVV